eukprot:12905958-Prorocentrum_lima.AAC.1
MDVRRGKKRPLTSGPSDYEECCKIHEHDMAVAMSNACSLKYGPCTFLTGLCREGVLVRTDYSGGCSGEV